MSTAYATDGFEIRIGITGTHDRHEGWCDHEVVDLGTIGDYFDDTTRKYIRVTHSLLKGVDLRSKDIQQLFANILEHCDLEAWAVDADADLSDSEDYEHQRRCENAYLANAAGQAGRGL